MSDDFVYFQDLQIYDGNPTYTLENSIVKCAGLGTLHDFDFQDKIDEEFASAGAGNFDCANAEGYWTVTGGKLQGIGSGAARWYRLYHNTTVAPSFVATFSKDDSRGAFVFCDDYCIYWTSIDIGLGEIDEDGALTVIARQPHSVTSAAEVAVAVRQQALTDFETVDWLSVAVYFDGRLVMAGSAYIEGSSLTNNVGFAVYGGDTVTFDNLNTPELKRIVEWTSVDPGENCSAGMNRAIGTTNLFCFCRYDGTLRVWIPGDRDVDWEVPTTRELRRPTRRNYFIPAHARMLGAFHEADSWNDDIAEQQGRPTFIILNDANLADQEEIKIGGEDAHRRVREGEDEWSIQIPGNPLIEPQDHITINGNDVRVTAIQETVARRGRHGAPVYAMQVEGTGYIEEDS